MSISTDVNPSGWIPVEERLPERDCSTLICTGTGRVCQARFYTEPKKWNGIAGKHAKYWMPLPLPPEEP